MRSRLIRLYPLYILGTLIAVPFIYRTLQHTDAPSAFATLTLLTKTIIQLGRDLGIAVVAEGIESSRQLGLLRDMGCGLGQGYLVAAPMSATEVETLLGTTVAQPGGGAVPPDPEAEPEAIVS